MRSSRSKGVLPMSDMLRSPSLELDGGSATANFVIEGRTESQLSVVGYPLSAKIGASLGLRADG